MKGSILKSPVSSSTSRFAVECCKQLSLLAQRIPPVAQQASIELVNVALEDPRPILRLAALKSLGLLTKHEFLNEIIVDKIAHIMTQGQNQVKEVICCIQLINKASDQNKLSRGAFIKLVDIMNDLLIKHDDIKLRVELVHSISLLLVQQEKDEEIDDLILENLNSLLILIAELSSTENLEQSTLLRACEISLSDMARLDSGMISELFESLISKCMESKQNYNKLKLLCSIVWSQAGFLSSRPLWSLLQYIAENCSDKEILAMLNLILLESRDDSPSQAQKVLDHCKPCPKSLFYMSRMAIRYGRYRVASYFLKQLKTQTCGYLSFHFERYIDCLDQFAQIEGTIREINEEDLIPAIKALNQATDTFEEISNDILNESAQVWIECRSVLFKSTSIFLLSSVCTPQAYLADELRLHSDKISLLLLKSRMAENSCRQRMIFLQQLLNCVAIIFEHGSSNLLVSPRTQAHFSSELQKLSETAFEECRQYLSLKKFHQAVLVLVRVLVPPPYLFFNKSKEESVKLEISPKPSNTQPNLARVSQLPDFNWNHHFQLGSSTVFVLEGTAPKDMGEILLLMKVESANETIEKKTIVKITKEYFFAKFIVEFTEPGNVYFLTGSLTLRVYCTF